jgi:hypothetical protein
MCIFCVERDHDFLGMVRNWPIIGSVERARCALLQVSCEGDDQIALNELSGLQGLMQL